MRNLGLQAVFHHLCLCTRDLLYLHSRVLGTINSDVGCVLVLYLMILTGRTVVSLLLCVSQVFGLNMKEFPMRSDRHAVCAQTHAHKLLLTAVSSDL